MIEKPTERCTIKCKWLLSNRPANNVITGQKEVSTIDILKVFTHTIFTQTFLTHGVNVHFPVKTKFVLINYHIFNSLYFVSIDKSFSLGLFDSVISSPDSSMEDVGDLLRYSYSRMISSHPIAFPSFPVSN